MAVTNDWGQGSKQNSIDWGQGATDNTINWGKSQTLSPGGETNISGASGFSNTLSTRFDGVDDYVNCGTNSSLKFERTDSFSFSLWFNRGAINVYHILLSNMNATGNRRGYFLGINTSNEVRVMLRTDTSNNNQRLGYTSTNTITDTNWHHIVFTYDGLTAQSSGKIYIDGVAETVVAEGGSSVTSIEPSVSTPFLMSGLNTSPLLPANGSIDEVSVFNTELSASDVSTIYNSGAPTDLTGTSGLVSWWRMGDNDTYPTITDNQGSNDGTMTNMSAGNFITNVPT